MIYGGWDSECPDCRIPNKYGGHTYKACGLTKGEHRRMSKLRKQAEEKAHQLMVEARERDLLPRAIIKMAYDEAERQTKRTDRGHGV